ncbi:DUF4135 domain-containing protein [Paracoccus benzoatiresistens]|uniref:DUF4135 domain-containing protein n=1 Tax=Paracoccus benzoatiresistens TaxID=2997341 RepID=A0ABT4J8N7_9RHOB|nr:DUF4135 domain-containing protein [Paracoccus sp. EF6]MCZ0963502.1 DUF4135 domain-containing protein [Paracoccus sp. EF6]
MTDALVESARQRFEHAHESALETLRALEPLSCTFRGISKLEKGLKRREQQRCDAALAYAREIEGQHVANQAALAASYGLAPGARIVDASDLGGDPHRGGRTPLLLSYSCGRRLVYKPRASYNELVFADVLRWFASGTGVEFALPQVVSTDSSSWSDVVQPETCSAEGVNRFYYRVGWMLFVWGVLGASDLNHENLVASGEWPVPIDMEFLATFSVNAALSGRPQDEYDILSTLALPLARSSKVDMSALGTASGSWDSTGRWRKSVHAPIAKGTSVFAFNKRSELVEGFRDAYHQSLSRGIDTTSTYLHDKFKQYPRARTRVAVRSTSEYRPFLNYASSEPVLLTKKGQRSRKLYKRTGVTVGRFGEDVSLRTVASMAKAEADALLAGDVPVFQVGPLGRTLLDSHGRIHASFAMDFGVNLILKRASQLCDRDKERQLCSINAALEQSEPLKTLLRLDDEPASR